MTIEEYKAFLKEGSPFFKLDVTIQNVEDVHHSVSYVIYGKNLGKARKFGDRGYVVLFDPCCYLCTDSRGHKKFTLCNKERFSVFIDGISKASECEIRELYKHLKYDFRGV